MYETGDNNFERPNANYFETNVKLLFFFVFRSVSGINLELCSSFWYSEMARTLRHYLHSNCDSSKGNRQSFVLRSNLLYVLNLPPLVPRKELPWIFFLSPCISWLKYVILRFWSALFFAFRPLSFSPLILPFFSRSKPQSKPKSSVDSRAN